MLDFTFPFSTNHQLIVDMANSAQETLRLCGRSNGELIEHHAQRIHELMHYRSHTVNTDGF